MDNKLKDDIASYVVDYPRFEDSANEVADLILKAVENNLINKILSLTAKSHDRRVFVQIIKNLNGVK